MTAQRRPHATRPAGEGSKQPKRIVLPHGKIIAVVNSKGGVGKSTISTLLALELASRGYLVRFVDCDKQGSSTMWLSGSESPIELTSMRDPNEIYDRLPPLMEGGHVVIADGPAKDDGVNRMLMALADIALLPCGPSALELQPLADTVGLLRQASVFHARVKGLPLGLIVPNQIQTRTILSKELLSFIRQFDLKVMPPLHSRQVYKDAAGQRKAVKDLAGRGAMQATDEINTLVAAVIRLLK